MSGSILELYELEVKLLEAKTSHAPNLPVQIAVLEQQLEKCLSEIPPCDFEKLVHDFEKELDLLESHGGRKRAGPKRKGNFRGAPKTALQHRVYPVLGDTFHFYNCQAHRAILFALAQIDFWVFNDDLELHGVAPNDSGDKLSVAVGLTDSPHNLELLDRARSTGAALLVKAHLALWALFYRQNEPRDGMRVSPADLCDVFDLRKHLHGGYQQKEQAVFLLEFLSSLTVRLHFRSPSEQTKLIEDLAWPTVKGHSHDDVVDGSTNCSQFVRPGKWFFNEDYQKRRKFVGVASRKLLELKADKHQWAILIGAYLMSQARIAKYKDKAFIPLRAKTILRNLGLAQTASAYARPGLYRDRFERALSVLVEHEVIQSWKWDKEEVFDSINPSDTDDAKVLAQIGEQARSSASSNEWREGTLLFNFPDYCKASGCSTRRRK